MLLVGQQVAMGGSVTAANPAVLVAASDVLFPSGAGSPLSYLIKGGSSVAANQIVIGGSLSGSTVAVGAISQAAATNAVLQINPGASLTATANNGSVILSATNNLTATGDTVPADGGAATNIHDQITLNGAHIISTSGTNGSVSVFGPAVLAGDTGLASSGSGAVRFASSLDGARNLTITGDAVFSGAVGAATRLNSVSVSGATQLDTGTVQTTSDQALTGGVTLSGATSLDATTGSIALGAVTGNNHTLGVTAAAGTVTLNGVSGTANLTLSDTTLNLNAGTYDVHGGAAYTFGAATTSGNLVLDQATTFGALTLATATTLDTSTGNLALDGTVGVGTRLTSLAISGTSQVAGANVWTNGTLTLKQDTTFGAVTLGSATTLDSSSGNHAQTLGAVTGAGHGLTINAGAGAVTLNGVAGTTGLTLTDGALTLNAATYDVDSGGAYTFGAATTNGTLTLKQDTTLSATTATFEAPVDGAFGLTVAGNAVFSGAVGGAAPLTGLTVDGTSQIQTGTVATSGAQHFAGAAAVANDATFTSSGGNIAFDGTLDGAHAITLGAASGTIALGGVVGGIAPMTTLSLTATGATIANAVHAGAIDVIDSGPAGSSLRLGDFTAGMSAGTPAATDFVLDAASVARLQATGALTIDASRFNKPAIVIGNVTIPGSVTGFGLYGLGNIFVWGTIAAPGPALTRLQIGGDAVAADLASQISVIATAGGRHFGSRCGGRWRRRDPGARRHRRAQCGGDRRGSGHRIPAHAGADARRHGFADASPGDDQQSRQRAV